MFTKEALKAFRPKRLAILFYRPLVATTLVLLIWRFGVQKSFLKGWLSFLDTEVLVGTFASVAVFHGFIAAHTLHGLIQSRQYMHQALDRRDFVQFVRFREERIFWPLHVLLLCFSLMLVTGVMLVDFQSRMNGYYAITCMVMVITLYWEVAMAADDPISSRWYDDDARITNGYGYEDGQISLDFRIMTMDQARAAMERYKAMEERRQMAMLQQRRYFESEDMGLMAEFRRRHRNFIS